MGRAFIRNRLCVYRCFIRRGRVVLILIGIKMGYIMKKILCFIGILVGCQLGGAQNDFEMLKTEVNFAQWSGKNEPMRVPPVLLNLRQFSAIPGRITLAREYLAGENHGRPNVGRPIRHEYVLRDGQKKNRIGIDLFIAPSTTEAHEYLIWRFINNSLPHAMQVKRAKPTRVLRLGHICFASGNKNENRFASIRFIRNNIIVEILAKGEKFQREARAIAETVDYLILKQKTGEDASAYYNREFQRLSENERRGIIEKITREGP